MACPHGRPRLGLSPEAAGLVPSLALLRHICASPLPSLWRSLCCNLPIPSHTRRLFSRYAAMLNSLHRCLTCPGEPSAPLSLPPCGLSLSTTSSWCLNHRSLCPRGLRRVDPPRPLSCRPPTRDNRGLGQSAHPRVRRIRCSLPACGLPLAFPHRPVHFRGVRVCRPGLRPVPPARSAQDIFPPRLASSERHQFERLHSAAASPGKNLIRFIDEYLHIGISGRWER